MRVFYLFAYDISCPKRQAAVRRLLQGYATGCQKSLFECWITTEELVQIRQTITALLGEHDAFHYFRLSDYSNTYLLGCAKPLRYDYFVVA